MKMNTVLHETCEQYVVRRLSEGWRVTGRYKHLVFLSTPDGKILRTVDLRNDIETLIPNAPGDECNIDGAWGCSSCPNHYTCVDNVPPRDDIYTYTHNSTFQRDLYNLEDTELGGTETINHITVYVRTRRDRYDTAKIKIAIKSGDTADESNEIEHSKDWTTYSNQWPANPDTGNPWQVNELDGLQAGVVLKKTGVAGDIAPRCNQVYVEVDYTPAPTTAYKNIITRFKLIVQGFQDIDARFKLWVQNYQDIATRFKLWVQKYTDTAIRFKLIAQEYKDISGRFRLTSYQLYQDTSTRFKLAVQAHQDIGARLRLVVQAYQDTTTRFRLTAQAFNDVATRFKLTVQAYQDIATRFRLIVKAFIDTTTRFKLQSVSHQDVSTRFYLYQPSWKALQILGDIAALEARIAGLKLKPKAHFEI